MLTKYRMASKVADEGIEVTVANGKRDGILTDLLSPGSDVVRPVSFRPRIDFAGQEVDRSREGFAKGELHVNEGAYEALLRPEATSLLPVGVCRVEGEFEKDDIVKIVSPDGIAIGVGRVACDSERARQVAGRKGGRPLVHYDYLYMD